MTEPTQRRVLICGDRNWTHFSLIYNWLEGLWIESIAYGADIVVIEGEAKGADTHGRLAAEDLGLSVIRFPADWTAYGRAAGPIRNKQMLDEGRPTEVHAFHDSISTSKGTLNMLKQALKHGIRCYLHTHDGVTEVV
jgi:hypothetical protein